ncbi:MAG: hypothetical protein DCC65_04715 [Planctomycetota bacterium]|nr:MAG: hypothetical protein DCC65_04715 [Planctomycetota bacterium]
MDGMAMVEHRLQRMERHQRILYGWMVGIVALAGLTLAMGQAAQTSRPATTEDRSDSKRPREDFRFVETAERIQLFDQDEKLRLTLGECGDGVGLAIADSRGQARLVLAVGDGGPYLSMFDDRGQERVGLMFLDDGQYPLVRMFDKNGKGSVLLASENEGATLRFSDSNERIRTAIGHTIHGSTVVMFDDNGKERIDVGTNKFGPSIRILDQEGHERATLGVSLIEGKRDGAVTQRPESSFILFDRSSSVIWKAP